MARVYDNKRTRKMLVRLPEVQAELKSEAEQIKVRAEANLAQHREQGHAQITLTRGNKRVDWFINLDDPHAAWAIEFGHVNHRTGKWVAGTYVLSRAAGLT